MRRHLPKRLFRMRAFGRWLALGALCSVSCDSTLPSARLRTEVHLPIPTIAAELPGPSRLTRVDCGESYRLTPHSVIEIAFDNEPDIKSSYQRYMSEEARYDFFVVSRDSLTPRMVTRNDISESRTNVPDSARPGRLTGAVSRRRQNSVEFNVEKQFFDTTELDFGVGLSTLARDETDGVQPFLSASVRYPLWVSRQKLERTSEEIFRRNELSTAQLGYIQTVRSRLENALRSFFNVLNLRRQVDHAASWERDLRNLTTRMEEIAGRDLTTDRSRVRAELAKASAFLGEIAGRLDIDRERLKGSCGLPFHAQIQLVDEAFNPFLGAAHDDLLRASIETDPEIATLRNEQRNAEVQLDLARRGKWDVSLLFDANSNLDGGTDLDGNSDWQLSVGVDVSAVDSRVTDSLGRQAQARIARFRQAIIARENRIFVDTLEPIIRIETLGASRDELKANIPRFREDFVSGIEQYIQGTLNIDDIVKRRESLFDQQQRVARLTFIVGINIAQLCTATGKFFDLINDHTDTADVDRALGPVP